MQKLKSVLLIPFNIKDKQGRWYDINSYDWDKLIKKSQSIGVFGKIGNSSINSITAITHQINNIYVCSFGVYGDIELLPTKPNDLDIFLKSGIEMVFRTIGERDYSIQYCKYNNIYGVELVFKTIGECDYSIQYCKYNNIYGFNAILKVNDLYGDILYRGKKIKKLLKNINK